MADRGDVCVLIPTYNEAETIGPVLEGFRDHGFEHLLVIDGGSTDDTVEIATAAGARVEQQSGTGKGQAVREAVREHVEQPYVLMADGDLTYRPADADAMLEPLLSGAAEHVIGNRFADMQPGAMTRLNQVGNRIINRGFAVIHGRGLTDILSGYRAFTTASFRRFDLSEDGFGIETELAVECVKHKVSTAVVPITYKPRPGESETNLRPFRDGGRILVTLYKMAKTNNPLFYFGSVGLLSTLTGILLAAYVAYDWFVNGVSHEVIALGGAAGILFGIQLLMFGVLSDMIVTLNREQTRQFREIAERLNAAGREESANLGADGRQATNDDPDDRTATAETEEPDQ